MLCYVFSFVFYFTTMEGFPVKSEGAASIQQFNFNFHSPLSHTSSDSDLIFRFGSNSPFSLLMPWTNGISIHSRIL